MIQDNLTAISNVSIYGIISFVIFASIFLLVLIVIIGAKKETLDEINRIPLSDIVKEKNL